VTYLCVFLVEFCRDKDATRLHTDFTAVQWIVQYKDLLSSGQLETVKHDGHLHHENIFLISPMLRCLAIMNIVVSLQFDHDLYKV